MLLKDLRISPVRSILTGFSMLVGIIAVICAVLLGTLGQDYLRATNEQLYGRTPHAEIIVTGNEFYDAQKIGSLIEDFEKRGEKATVTVESTQHLLFTPVKTGEAKTAQEILAAGQTFNVVYTTAGYRDIYNLPIVSGRWLSSDIENAGLEIVLNKAAANRFEGATKFHVGSLATLVTTPVNVVGVVNDGVNEARGYLNILPLSYFASDLIQSETALFYWLNKHNLTEQKMRTYIDDYLVDMNGGKISDFRMVQEDNNYRTVLEILQLVFIIVAVLLLFISAVGILNIGLASLEQRTYELLIRRALGATRLSLAFLVLGGAILVALITSTLAITISYCLIIIVTGMLPIDSPVTSLSYPYVAAIVAVFAAIFTAFLGATFPTIKAIRLQPAYALR